MSTRSVTQQALSFVLALAVTVGMLGGINGLAVPPAPDALLASTPAPVPGNA